MGRKCWQREGVEEALVFVAMQGETYWEARGRAANDDESQKRAAVETCQRAQYRTFIPEKTAGDTSSVTSSVKEPVTPASEFTSITVSVICVAN